MGLRAPRQAQVPLLLARQVWLVPEAAVEPRRERVWQVPLAASPSQVLLEGQRWLRCRC